MIKTIMERQFLKTLLHASCLLLMVKCSEQTAKRTIEGFHDVMLQNFATCEKIDTEKTGNVITHQSNEDIGIKEFAKVCLELNGNPQENATLTYINVRKRYEGKDENKKDHIANIIIAMQRYLANPEKQLLHVNNLEVAFYTLGYKDIDNFDFAVKHLNNTETAIEGVSFLINESVVKFILTSVKSAFVDVIAVKLARFTAEEVIGQYSNHETKLSNVDDFCDAMFAKLIGDAYLAELDYFLIDDRNEILWKNLADVVLEKIEKYQNANQIKVINVKNEDDRKMISDKLIEDIKNNLKDVLTLIWPAISALIKKSEKERFKTACVDFYAKLKSYDFSFYRNRYIKGMLVYDGARPNLYHYVKSKNCDEFARIFEHYLDVINFDDLISEQTQMIVTKKKDEIRNRFYCKEKTQIICHGEMTAQQMSCLCKVLIQTKILESQSIYKSLYFNDQNDLTMPDIRKFDRKYSKKGLQQSANQQENPVSEVYEIFMKKENTEGKMAFIKYMKGNDTVDYDNPINRTCTSEFLVGNETIMPTNLLLNEVGFVNYKTMDDLLKMENSIVSIWAKTIGKRYELPLSILRIPLPNNEIVLITDKDGIKTSMVYDIPYLHHISREDQLYGPEEIYDSIWHFEDLYDEFFADSNSFMQIYFLTGKICDIRNIYSMVTSEYHHAEMSISYHVPRNYVRNEGPDGMYGQIENAIRRIQESEGINCCLYNKCLEDCISHYNICGKESLPVELYKTRFFQQTKCIDDTCASVVIDRRHAEGSTYHLAYKWKIFSDTRVRLYKIDSNSVYKATIILRRELREHLDSSLSSLPLMILAKILNSPSNNYEKYFASLGLDTGSIRFVTRLICWIHKYYPIHQCSWNVDDNDIDKLIARKKVKEMLEEHIQKTKKSDIAITKESVSGIEDRDLQPNRTMIERGISELVDFVFGSIDNAFQDKTIRFTAFYNRRPTNADIVYIRTLKKEIAKLVEKNNKNTE